MKRKLMFGICGALVLVLSIYAKPARAIFGIGDVVFDPTAYIQMIKDYAQQIKEYENMVEQLKTMKEELSSINGIRNMAGIISSQYDTETEVDTESLRARHGLRDSESLGLREQEAAIYDKETNNSVEWLGKSEKSLQESKDRFAELQKLVDKVNSCEQQKDILDLQARIQAESALLQNELGKLAMIKSAAEAKSEVIAKQKEQALLKTAGEVKNVNF